MYYEFYFTNQLLQTEFNSENFRVTMKFKKKIPKINFMLDSLGPFCSMEKAYTNVWCYDIFQKTGLGELVVPKWLNSKWLEKKILDEVDIDNLQIIPRNYIEFTYTIYKKTLPYSNNFFKQIVLIEELFSIRTNKLAMGLAQLQIPIRAFKIENKGQVELINFRKILQIQLQIINSIHSN